MIIIREAPCFPQWRFLSWVGMNQKASSEVRCELRHGWSGREQNTHNKPVPSWITQWDWHFKEKTIFFSQTKVQSPTWLTAKLLLSEYDSAWKGIWEHVKMLTITKPSGLGHMRAMPKRFVREKKGRIGHNSKPISMEAHSDADPACFCSASLLPCPFLPFPLH